MSIDYLPTIIPYRASIPHSVSVKENESLHIKCVIDFTEKSASEDQFLYLGTMLGDVSIYLNGEMLSRTVGRSNNVRVWIPPKHRRESQLLLIGEGSEKYKRPGPASIVPVFLSRGGNHLNEIIGKFNKTQFLGKFQNIGILFGLLIMLLPIWLTGKKYADITWLILSISLMIFYNFLIFLMYAYDIVVPNPYWQFVMMTFKFCFFNSFVMFYRVSTSTFSTIFKSLIYLSCTLIIFSPDLWAFFNTSASSVARAVSLIFLYPLALGIQSLGHTTGGRRFRVILASLLLSCLCCSYISDIFLVQLKSVSYSREVTFISLIFFGLVLVYQGIASQKELDEKKTSYNNEKARNTAMESAAAMVAHDVRKPFKLFSEFEKRIERAESSKEVIEIIGVFTKSFQKSRSGIDSTLTQILEYQRVAQLDKTENDIYDLINDTFCAVFSIKSSVSLTLTTDFKHFSNVSVDKEKMKRVLVNIVGNAQEAMKSIGEIVVRSIEKEGKIYLSIFNTDSYLSPSECDAVFESYYTKGKVEGTGLGLAISKQFVEAHGGNIWATSSKENGTVFHIELPAGNGKATRIENIIELSTAYEIKTTSYISENIKKVILIEDCLFTRENWRSFYNGVIEVYESPTEFFSKNSLENQDLYDDTIFIVDFYFEAREEMKGDEFATIVKAKGECTIFLCSEIEFPGGEIPSVFSGRLAKTPLTKSQLTDFIREVGNSAA